MRSVGWCRAIRVVLPVISSQGLHRTAALPLPPHLLAAEGERCKRLMLTLARPEPTQEEGSYKKGEP